MPAFTPDFQDRDWDLVYKANAALEPFVDVSTYLQPNAQDRKWDLWYKLANNIGNITGGGSGTAQVVSPPSNITDFSMLPGGVAPSSGVYFAPRDEWTLWTIAAGDSQWTIVDKNNP